MVDIGQFWVFEEPEDGEFTVYEFATVHEVYLEEEPKPPIPASITRGKEINPQLHIIQARHRTLHQGVKR